MPLLHGQAAEQVLLANLAEADDRVPADEAQAAQVTGERADCRQRAVFWIDKTQLARAGVEHPQLSVVPSRRVRHRQAAANDLVALHVDDHAAARFVLAPSADAVRRAERRHVSWP